MGTATDAVNGLAVPEADRALFVAHIAVAHAVCYIFGYAGVISFCTVIVPTTPEDRPEDGGIEARAGIGNGPRQTGAGIRLAKIRAARLSIG